jgi:hypothetical protein
MRTPRSSNRVPSALVPVQWISTKTVSPSTADRRVSARKSGWLRATPTSWRGPGRFRGRSGPETAAARCGSPRGSRPASLRGRARSAQRSAGPARPAGRPPGDHMPRPRLVAAAPSSAALGDKQPDDVFSVGITAHGTAGREAVTDHQGCIDETVVSARDRPIARRRARLVLYPAALALIAVAWHHQHSVSTQSDAADSVRLTGATSQAQRIRAVTSDRFLTSLPGDISRCVAERISLACP